jgi:predicted O-methyltransferase YrrM
MTPLAILVSLLVRATGATHVLLIGGGAEAILASAGAQPAHGRVLAIEPDAEVAALIRERLVAAGHADRVSVMIGAPTRYLHKIAGPFEMIVDNGDPGRREAMHERLMKLLAPAGTLVTPNNRDPGRYNEILTADRRLQTALVNIAGGVAISVRQRIPS